MPKQTKGEPEKPKRGRKPKKCPYERMAAESEMFDDEPADVLNRGMKKLN